MTEPIKGLSSAHYEARANGNEATQEAREEQTFNYKSNENDKMKGLQVEVEKQEGEPKTNPKKDDIGFFGKTYLGLFKAAVTGTIILPASLINMVAHFWKGVFTGNVDKEVETALDAYSNSMDKVWKDE